MEETGRDSEKVPWLRFICPQWGVDSWAGRIISTYQHRNTQDFSSEKYNIRKARIQSLKEAMLGTGPEG